MKLRNRTTRVVSDVKQEDCKPAPNATGKSLSILGSDASSYNLVIKQEDAKDDTALLEQYASLVQKNIATGVIFADKGCRIEPQYWNIASQFTTSSLESQES
ncbi:hypothetical protein MUCCIDRAFT_109660 [Mucor lusitanicus CBS 277.49]|uniref:Uncharacterized protein n=1 Tax=Mucor lusitanicus CBS 277.49 TaxID=747725 RepID=A0A168KVG7_MUCCL|nr:hypothetical protein MUCCIDRAFT_109660 [Mucor lusitanicus CBS 277.49]